MTLCYLFFSTGKITTYRVNIDEDEKKNIKRVSVTILSQTEKTCVKEHLKFM